MSLLIIKIKISIIKREVMRKALYRRKKVFLWFFFFIVATGIIMIFLKNIQEKLIFYPEKLPDDYKYKFEFTEKFIERNYTPEKNVLINSLFFKSVSSKGLVFYLHGNAGSLRSWGNIAEDFIKNNYDVLIIDYRGYGKSRGKMSEKALYSDALYIYNNLKKEYMEEHIIVYGRSIGTGIAAYLASKRSPGLLILESPYYSLSDIIKKYYPIVPEFLINYKFKTNTYFEHITCPVKLFHGDKDEIIYYGSSLKLKKLFKKNDELITIEGGHHNDLSSFNKYQQRLKEILN